MIQDIITYIIITITTVYTLYSFVKVFIPSKNKTAHSCCGGCSGCALKNNTKLQKISIKSLY
ncbi:MAG: FeoB-associated Cys-rich membrane protein [Bacteroidales bacterium]|nr:FeoB-associated Cys-rich membrane protein [Bacteroidales bacterium]